MANKKTQNQTQIQDKNKRIEQLLSMVWDTESTARILAITSQILELDPNNVEALILKSDNTVNLQQKIEILERALKALKSPNASLREHPVIIDLAIHQRLAFLFMEDGDVDNSLKESDITIKLAEDTGTPDEYDYYSEIKTLRYRALIEKGEWQRILSLVMQDEDHTPGWAYARLVAAWALSPEPKAKNCVKFFWDALISGPDIPFYMLGFFDEPEDDEDDESIISDFDFAVLYYDVLSFSDYFHDWFSRGVVLFGLLSNRFEGKERDYMIDALDSLGGFNDYERMSKILVEGDDMAVIEAMAENKCLID
ncbi:MAG: hypothetical protein IJJ09_02895 [Synergistaceae bacterium]|nr:hypothetical protein [Synergistaceae bacterium]